MVVDVVAGGVAEAGSEGGVDERIQLNKQEEDDLKKRLIEYNELHKGVFPNDGEVVGIYYVSSSPSPTLPPSVASVFSICSSQFPSCLSVLVCDASSGGYTVLRQSTNLGGAAELKKAECEVAMTSVSRTVIESVVEGMEGEKGDENLREAVEELDDKLRLMEEYIESGGRDYETIRRIKGVVSSMNKNQSSIGGVVGTAENGVEALRFLAEVTRGTEKRRERTAHLF
ncbi:hypothetical protein TrCOL_g7702 [Triparma columacea]|uniref:Uncharacterized protein n=1 Tax=Triparma columacea TaxID=722753 RepID=A0A9W7L134_9STRA|nr:hypothetical protein TrCOL_g7702 [Triparma columacea]